MCTGDCAEFDAHIPAAKAFVDEHGPTLPDRSYCEQRLAWYGNYYNYPTHTISGRV
jgi:hypothetical protein